MENAGIRSSRSVYVEKLHCSIWRKILSIRRVNRGDGERTNNNELIQSLAMEIPGIVVINKSVPTVGIVLLRISFKIFLTSRDWRGGGGG